jgi:hypothetical protein
VEAARCSFSALLGLYVVRGVVWEFRVDSVREFGVDSVKCNSFHALAKNSADLQITDLNALPNRPRKRFAATMRRAQVAGPLRSYNIALSMRRVLPTYAATSTTSPCLTS